jgi:hypothetical protein
MHCSGGRCLFSTGNQVFSNEPCTLPKIDRWYRRIPVMLEIVDEQFIAPSYSGTVTSATARTAAGARIGYSSSSCLGQREARQRNVGDPVAVSIKTVDYPIPIRIDGSANYVCNPIAVRVDTIKNPVAVRVDRNPDGWIITIAVSRCTFCSLLAAARQGDGPCQSPG